MIIGTGSDLCNIERIARSLERFGARFEKRVFTQVERAKAQRRPFTIAGTYAKRFAAKEAFSKAVGTGFRRGVFMKDIGVVNAPIGRADAGADRRCGGPACRRLRLPGMRPSFISPSPTIIHGRRPSSLSKRADMTMTDSTDS